MQVALVHASLALTPLPLLVANISIVNYYMNGVRCCDATGGVWTVARLHLKVPPMTARVCDHDTGSQGAFLLSLGGVTLKQVTLH